MEAILGLLVRFKDVGKIVGARDCAGDGRVGKVGEGGGRSIITSNSMSSLSLQRYVVK